MLLSKETLLNWTILIVDDDLKSLDIAQKLLRHYGAITHTALNGQEALEKAQAIKPSFILTDISMPVMNGWELIDALKKDHATAAIPIIALTAYAMQGDREKAIAAGCHNYLSKPLTPATFIHDLMRILVDIPVFAERIPATPKELP